MTQALIAVGTGILIAIVSAFVTVRLALHRFRAEKVWERKVLAYERIIEAVHDLKSFSDRHLKAEMAGREVPEDTDQELRTRSRAAHAVVSKMTDIGSFIISAEALRILNQFEKDSDKASSPEGGWVDYLIRDNEASATCLERLIAEAKRDLSIK